MLIQNLSHGCFTCRVGRHHTLPFSQNQQFPHEQALYCGAVGPSLLSNEKKRSKIICARCTEPHAEKFENSVRTSKNAAWNALSSRWVPLNPFFLRSQILISHFLLTASILDSSTLAALSPQCSPAPSRALLSGPEPLQPSHPEACCYLHQLG